MLCHNDFHEGNVLAAEGTDGWAVTEFIDVENAIAVDPLLDLAKTDCYSGPGNKAKLSGLIQGYGSLPDDWPDRLSLCQLYHALELWDWFAAIGDSAPLPSIVEDIRRLLAPERTVGLSCGLVFWDRQADPAGGPTICDDRRK